MTTQYELTPQFIDQCLKIRDSNNVTCIFSNGKGGYCLSDETRQDTKLGVLDCRLFGKDDLGGLLDNGKFINHLLKIITETEDQLEAERQTEIAQEKRIQSQERSRINNVETMNSLYYNNAAASHSIGDLESCDYWLDKMESPEVTA